VILLLALLAHAEPVCLDRAEYAARVVAPLADLRQCLTDREADALEREALAAAVQAAATERDEARHQLGRARRARWRWVVLGAAGGVTASAATVWVGVQVVAAR